MLPELLADENIPMPVIEALRAAGHDVLSIRESAPGIPDEAVLRMAVTQNRILVTFDRDYGELVFGMDLEPPQSIIYLRFAPTSASVVSEAILSLLADPGSVVGSMVIVSHQGVRRRRFRREPH